MSSEKVKSNDQSRRTAIKSLGAIGLSGIFPGVSRAQSKAVNVGSPSVLPSA